MKWKKYSEELPEIGKKFISFNPYSDDKFSVCAIGYTIQKQNNYGDIYKADTEKDLKKLMDIG